MCPNRPDRVTGACAQGVAGDPAPTQVCVLAALGGVFLFLTEGLYLAFAHSSQLSSPCVGRAARGGRSWPGFLVRQPEAAGSQLPGAPWDLLLVEGGGRPLTQPSTYWSSQFPLQQINTSA